MYAPFHKCYHCGRDFADHIYQQDSINKYLCADLQQDTKYGGFHGGDPRNFHPDYEVCDEREITRHNLACKEAEKNPAKRNLPHDFCGSRKFGIGTQVIFIETWFEPMDATEEELARWGG